MTQSIRPTIRGSAYGRTAHHSRIVRSLFLLAVISPLFTRAVRADDTANRFTNDISWTKQVIDENKRAYDDLAGDSQAIEDLTAADLVAAKKYFDELDKQWETAVTFFEQNKEPEARAAQTAAQKFGEKRGRWRERLACRQRQADNAPTEEWTTAQRGWTAPEQAAELTAMIETRKKASETWGLAAEATTPDADDATVAKALDAALMAAAKVEVADYALNWARQNHDLLAKRALSPELGRKVSAVEDTQNEITKVRLAREELDAKSRALTKQREKQVEDANNELGKAIKAQEDAKNLKP